MYIYHILNLYKYKRELEIKNPFHPCEDSNMAPWSL